MSDIFFSHVEEDRELVVSVADGLEQAGYTTWYYERDSLPGIPFVRQLPGVIDGAQAVVVVISADALGSPHVYSEIVEAYKIGKPFIPLLLDLSHAEFRRQRRDWALMLGAAVFVTVPAVNVSDIVPRILVGLAQMHLRPSGTPSAATTHATPSAPPPKPAPKPVMAPAATPRGALNVATSGNRISNLRKEQWETALTSTPTATPKLPDNPVKTSRRRFVRTFVPVALLGGGFAYWNFIRSPGSVVEFVHDGPVFAMAVHPTDSLVATGGGDGTIRLWDLDQPRESALILASGDQARSVAFNHDGSLLAAGTIDSRSARIWDVKTRQQILPNILHPDEVFAVAFNADGTVFATGCQDAAARLWDPHRFFTETANLGHDSRVLSLAFHSSEHLMATGNGSALARVYNVDATTRPIAELQHDPDKDIYAVAFSPVGSMLATGGSEWTVRLWDFERDVSLSRLEHGAIVRGVAFHPGGTMLATGNNDGTLRMFHVDQGGADPVPIVKRENAHSSFIRAMAFTPDGSKLLTAANDNLVRVWTTDLDPVRRL